jgi:acylphosphatase
VNTQKQQKPVKTRAHVFVSGRVQGVFFRSEIKREARKHRVKGWVRNTPNNRVEAVFEGEEKNVMRLVEFCKRGPTAAQVMQLDVKWEPHSGNFTSFEIEY